MTLSETNYEHYNYQVCLGVTKFKLIQHPLCSRQQTIEILCATTCPLFPLLYEAVLNRDNAPEMCYGTPLRLEYNK